MKKIIIFVCIIILTFCIKVYAAPIVHSRVPGNLRLPEDVDLNTINEDDVLKIPSVDAGEKIYDFADLLSDSEEKEIFNQLNEYIHNTGLDAVIITTNDIKDFSLKDYSYLFYDYNDFANNGILFVIYNGSDKKSVFIGKNGSIKSEVFSVYTDEKVSEILKDIYANYIAKDDYFGACKFYIKLIDKYYIETFGSYPQKDDYIFFPLIEILVVSFVLTFIITALVYTMYQTPQRKVNQNIKTSMNLDTMIVQCEYDKPVSDKKISNL